MKFNCIRVAGESMKFPQVKNLNAEFVAAIEQFILDLIEQSHIDALRHREGMDYRDRAVNKTRSRLLVITRKVMK